VWRIFSSVAHISKFGTDWHKWGIFLGLPRFTNCAPIFQVLRSFPSVAYFGSVVHFSKGGAVFQVWRIFSSLVHFPKYGAFLQMWWIWQNVAHLFLSVAHFVKCGTFFQGCEL